LIRWRKQMRSTQREHCNPASLGRSPQLLAITAAFCAAFFSPTQAIECSAPTRQSDLQSVSACSSALCCPRELDLQINLVKTVAGKLKSMGYSVRDPDSKEDESPEVRGIYSPKIDSALRTAIRQFKKDKNITDSGDEITYSLVRAVLGVDLFERWKTR
jgi:hypothetical protein